MREDEIDKDEKEEDALLGDPLDLMTKAIKVHTKDFDLNEDTTLSNLNAELSKHGKYVMEQVAIIGVLRSFFKTDCNIIKYSNYLDEWGKIIRYEKPEKIHMDRAKQILMNRVHSIQLLSRAVRGRPLKAFLTYGKNDPPKSEEVEKRGIMSKILGSNKKQEDDFEDE